MGNAPGEHAQAKLNAMSPSKRATRNMSGTVASVQQAYELKREIKEKERKKLGLGKNPLSNMTIAEHKIKKKDKKKRLAVGDKSEDCLGIVRKNDWCDGMKMWLWGMNSITIATEASKQMRLVGYMDATKHGNLGLIDCPHNANLQFLSVRIQPADLFINAEDFEMMPKRFKMKGVELILSISNRNKAKDVDGLLDEFGQDCKESTNVTPDWLLIHTDCAGQLKNGIIRATRSEGQVTNQIMYANVILYIYLRLSERMEKEIESSGDWKESAEWAFKTQRQYANTAVHDCASHCWRAHNRWPKASDRSKDAKEVKQNERQFVDLFGSICSRVKGMDDIAEAIVEYAAAIALLRKTTIKCESYDSESEVEDNYDKIAAQVLADDLDVIFRRKAIGLRLESDEQMRGLIDEAMKNNLHENSQSFNGGELIDPIAQELTDTQRFATSYLKSKDVDAGTAVLGVSYVYCPYDDDGQIKPQCIHGFEIKIQLPFDGSEGIASPFHSNRAAKYLRDTWGTKMTLWVGTGPSVIGKACNIKMKSSNQMMEGSFHSDKHINTKFKKAMVEPAAFFWYSYNNLEDASSYLVKEMEKADDYLKQRNAVLKKVANEKSKKEAAIKSATEDSREMQRTDAEDMVWQRKTPKSWKQAEQTMRNALTEAMKNDPGVKQQNPNQWHAALVCHLAAFDSNKMGWKFMSKPTFNNWLLGKKPKKLDEEHFEVIKSFVEKYGHCIDYDDDASSSSDDDEEEFEAENGEAGKSSNVELPMNEWGDASKKNI